MDIGEDIQGVQRSTSAPPTHLMLSAVWPRRCCSTRLVSSSSKPGYSASMLLFVFTLLIALQCNGVTSRSDCILFGCDAGWQCDTSYHLSGDCVQVFNDDDINGDELNDEKLFGVENVDRNSLVTAVGAAAGAGLAQELHVNDANSQAAAKPLSVAGDSYLPDTSSLGDEDDDEEVEEDDGGGQAVNSGLSGLSLGGSSDVTPNPLSAAVPTEPLTIVSRMKKVQHSKCEQTRAREVTKCDGMIGCFISQCNEDGAFSSMQCHDSTGYCWCVDTLGQRIEATVSPPGHAQPNCDAVSREGSSEPASAGVETSTLPVQLSVTPYGLASENTLREPSDLRQRQSSAVLMKEAVTGEEDPSVRLTDNHARAAVADQPVLTTSPDSSISTSSRSNIRSSRSDTQDEDSSSAEGNAHPLEAANILLWVIVACCIAFTVSIPLLFVCLYRWLRRTNDPVKPYIVYKRQPTASDSASASISGNTAGSDRDKELLLRTARNHRHGSVSTLSEKSVLLPSQQSSEAVNGHMEIYTGHRVLEYLEEHITNPEKLSEEWKGVSGYQAEDESTSDAKLDYNSGKNRYPDILPYNNHRVRLDCSNNASRSDYINATAIFDRNPRYPTHIATQGPLDSTVADFWQMVWEMNSTIIVMLTKLTEGGMSQCHRYWPKHGQQVYHMFEVQLVSEHVMSDDYCVRSFYLVNLKTKMSRTVTQYQFLSWTHVAVPTIATTTHALLDFRRKVKKSYSDVSAPIIVHDNAGVGRAGCYILIDILLMRLSENLVKEIDMAACVEHLRDQRMHMVQTEDQFKFAYSALLVEVRSILDAMPK
eukprot:scpid34510/ scgid21219/ Receptor-type tyrosine-protein phosphatase-like N; Islet cell antigen 512; Islet cell autoantigen 3; PTP IA-2